MNKWIKEGFEAFRKGEFGNGGQNLYVSAKGVLQRIFNYDLDANGYPDIPLANSHRACDRGPVKVFPEFPDTDTYTLLPTNGINDAFVADLNGDGYDDIIVACQGNGTHADNDSIIYYGSPNGVSEDSRALLYTPNAVEVTVGDYNGNGKKDICFIVEGRKLKIFTQDDRGFNGPDYYEVVLDKNIETTYTYDVNGDGYDDIYCKLQGGEAVVFWGSADGIRADHATEPFFHSNSFVVTTAGTTASRAGVYGEWRSAVVEIDGQIYLFCADKENAYFYTYTDGKFACAFSYACRCPVYVGAKDLDGDGKDDIVLLCAEDKDKKDTSYVLWNEDGRFGEAVTEFETQAARPVSFGEINGELVVGVAQSGRSDFLNMPCKFIKFNGREISEIQEVEGEDCPRILFGRFNGKAEQVALVQHEWADRVRGDEEVFIFMGDENGYDGNRRLELLGMSAVDTIMADFNDDGRPDVFICNCNESVISEDWGSYIYYRNEMGEYKPEDMVTLPTIRAHGCAVGDFSHSGYLDIITGGILNREIRIFRGGPDGYSMDRMDTLVFGPDPEAYEPLPFVTPTPNSNMSEEEEANCAKWGELRWMYAADFNGDGWLDLFVSNIGSGHAYIFWNGPDGFSMDRKTVLNAEGAICANVADLNKNGYPDLIIGCHYSPSKASQYETYVIIYWGGPDGYQEHRKTMLPGFGANAVSIGDFNGDGWLDIYACAYNNGRFRDLNSYVYFNDHGHFSYSNKQIIYTHSGSGCIAGDFNGDGYCDLAVASHKDEGDHRTTSYLYYGTPKGLDLANPVELPSLGPHGMSTVDPGNMMNRDVYEYYTSETYATPSRAASITYEAEFLSTSWVELEYRTASCEKRIEEAEWKKVEAGEEFRVDAVMQYRLALGAKCACGTPRITRVEVTFS